MENKYYVYLHIKEINGEPFYVGKGKDNRYKSKHKRSKYWKRIVNKYGYDIIFLEINLSEQDALQKEIYWIKRIGRKDLGQGPLVNFTDGGDGISGYKHTDETKEKCGIKNIGNKYCVGRNISDETKDKLKQANLGKKHTEESKEKIAEASRNRSEETRKKLSETSKGRKNILGRIHINKNGIRKFVKEEELKFYLNDGWLISNKNKHHLYSLVS